MYWRSISLSFSLSLLYLSKLNAVLYPQRVSLPLKKTPWYALRGVCCPIAHPVRYCTSARFRLRSPFGALFLKIWTCCVGVVARCRQECMFGDLKLWKKCCHTRPDHSAEYIVCRGQEGTKGNQGTLRPDFQSNTRPKIFFIESQCHHKIQKDSWKKIQV